MDLLPDHLRAALPPLGSQQHLVDPLAYARFLMPDTGYVWYITEGSPDGDDYRLFGFVVRGPNCSSWDHFRLSDLTQLQGPYGPPVVRD